MQPARLGRRPLAALAFLVCTGICVGGLELRAADNTVMPIRGPQFGQTYSGVLAVQGWSLPLPEGKWVVLSHMPSTTAFGDITQDRVVVGRIEGQTVIAWIDIAAAQGSPARTATPQPGKLKTWCGEHNPTLRTYQVTDDRVQTECLRRFFPALFWVSTSSDYRGAAKSEAELRGLKFSVTYLEATQIFEDGDKNLTYAIGLSPEAYGSKTVDSTNWVDGIVADPAKARFVEAFKAWTTAGYDMLAEAFHTGKVADAKRHQWEVGPQS